MCVCVCVCGTGDSAARLSAHLLVLEVVGVGLTAAVGEGEALPVHGVVVPAGEAGPTRSGVGRLRTASWGGQGVTVSMLACRANRCSEMKRFNS